MNCPRCENSVLDERERDGVNIDVCRACRGIWLDRGELEKIVARAAQEMEAYDRGRRRDHDDDDDYDEPRRGAWRDGDDRGRPPRKRRWFESLGDIFD